MGSQARLQGIFLINAGCGRSQSTDDGDTLGQMVLHVGVGRAEQTEEAMESKPVTMASTSVSAFRFITEFLPLSVSVLDN